MKREGAWRVLTRNGPRDSAVKSLGRLPRLFLVATCIIRALADTYALGEQSLPLRPLSLHPCCRAWQAAT
jgi:hypothetical protein